MLQLQKAYSVGNSTVATLPRVWGVVPGAQLRSLPRRKSRVSFEIVEENKPFGYSTSQTKNAYLKKVSGAIKSNMPTEAVMDTIRYFKDRPYEKI